MFTNFEDDGSLLRFEIHDLDLSIVNSLRRIILSEIPNVALAFDQLSDNNPDIQIHVNTGALHNEYLGHRISLIPFYLSEDEIEDFAPHKYVFHLHVKNTTHEVKSVTTHDIEIFDEHGKKYSQAFHNRVLPANPITKEHILITKLRPNLYNSEKGEEIHVEFKLSKNIAKIHSRWSPVSCCSLSNKIDDEKYEVALEEKYAHEERQKGASLTPEQRLKIKSRFDSMEKYRFFHTNKYEEPNIFHFQIESECAMSPRYIFDKACWVLMQKLNLLIQNIERGDVQVHALHQNQNFYEVLITNEDYTLLNVLQSMIYNNEIRSNPNTQLEYIGYYQPHPLDSAMILKLKFKADTNVAEFLTSNVRNILNTLQACKTDFRTLM